MKAERKQLETEKKFRRHLGPRLREKLIKRITKQEVALSYVIQSLKSRRQEESDVATGLHAIRTVTASVEAEVREIFGAVLMCCCVDGPAAVLMGLLLLC